MPEKEYIKREALLAAYDAEHVGPPGRARDLIANAPAADVRPVVTCGECKYAPFGPDDGDDRGFALEWPHDEWPEENPCPCKCEDGWYSRKPEPDFFCANGKRREEN